MERSNKIRRSSNDRKAPKVPPLYARRWSHSGFIVRNKIPISWKSPSSTSTTSLGQLHERLEALPRYTFDKVPVSVCALPDLSIISEASEKSDLHSVVSNTQTTEKINRLGRAGVQSFVKIKQKFKTIVEEATESKNKSIYCVQTAESSTLNTAVTGSKACKDRCLTPVDEDHSTSLLLVATLGSDDSIINETIERLPDEVHCTNDNIVELLAREALQNKAVNKDRLEDSGINTGNRKTQESNSETIENTPDYEVNKNITFRKVYSNRNKKTSSSTDESNTEVIVETPVNYVSLRKKPQLNQSSDDSFKELDEEDAEFQIVQDFVSQHYTQNSDEQTASKTDFNIEILECVSHIIDVVCQEIQGLKQPEPNENIMDIAQTTKKEKAENFKTAKIEGKVAKSLKLKKKTPTKKKTPKSRKNKKHQENDLNLSLVVESEKEKKIVQNQIEESLSPLDKIINTKNQANSERKVTPPGRRRRKLFSPKVDEIEKPNVHIPETEDDDTILSEIKTNIDMKKRQSKATCYKDIEKDRIKRIRQVRERKSKQSPVLPKTRKINDLFDQIKETVNNQEPIRLVDKNKCGRDIAVYNFSSGSEDEEFKQKKIEVGKRVSSTTIGSVESTLSRRGRTITRINYSEPKTESSSEAKIKPGLTEKRKVRTKGRTIKKVELNENFLLDQKMRKATPVDLDTSLVQEEPKQQDEDVIQPKLKQMPLLELIPENDFNEEVQTALQKEAKKADKRKKITKSLSTKKGKGKNNLGILEVMDGNKTNSPLPGLVIEKMPAKDHKGNDSISAKTIHNLHRIIKDDSEAEIAQLNASQLLILDENNTSMNTSKQIENDINALIASNKNTKKKQNYKTTKDKNEIRESKIDRSISTMGNSPITAHGDFDEEPPSTKTLSEVMKPRHLELEELNEADAAYYIRLENQINNITDSTNRVSMDVSEQQAVQLFVNLNSENVAKNPEEIVKSSTSERDDRQFFSDDIAKWIPAKNYTFESDQSSKVSDDKLEKENVNRLEKNDDTASKTPKVVLQRINDEEISKWVAPKNSPHPESCQTTCAKSKETIIEPSDENTVVNAKEMSDKDLTSLNGSQKSKGSVRLTFKSVEPGSKAKKTVDKIQPLKGKALESEKAVIKTMSKKLSDKEFDLITLSGSQTSNGSVRLSFKNVSVRSETKKSVDNNRRSSKTTTKAQKENEDGIGTPSKTARKRKLSPEPQQATSSKCAYDAASTSLCDSGPSESSVQEWFRKYGGNADDEDLHLSLKDNIENVMEKLDTTLAEIHQGTSKKFVNMFVKAQKSLDRADEERHKLFKEFAKRSKQLDKIFMEDLKRQACTAISEDSKQKRAMVYLLKEDMHTIIDKLNKQRIERRACKTCVNKV